MIRSICGVIAAVLFAAAAAAAQGADWPTRPVRFIVPFPPGGTVDPLARLLGTRLTASLGQQFVIDNRTGGSGSIGTAIAAKARSGRRSQRRLPRTATRTSSCSIRTRSILR